MKYLATAKATYDWLAADKAAVTPNVHAQLSTIGFRPT